MSRLGLNSQHDERDDQSHLTHCLQFEASFIEFFCVYHSLIFTTKLRTNESLSLARIAFGIKVRKDDIEIAQCWLVLRRRRS